MGIIFIIMKRLLFTFVILLVSINSLIAQCNLNLGPDLYGCTGFQGYDPLELGNNFSYTGSVGIATYQWSACYKFNIGSTNYVFHASSLLNDTTIENPKVISDFGDSVYYKLTVTDSLGSICSDSIQVVFSYLGTHLGYFSSTIMSGDSVFLNHSPNAFGGIGTLNYLWRPNHGLRDSTLPYGFWAKPNTSIAYYVTVTDSVGCTATAAPLYVIIVNHIGIGENRLNKLIKVFPNPTNDILNVSISELKPNSISLSNIQGQELYYSDFFHERIDISGLPSGMYILTLQTDKGVVRKKIKKE